MQQNLIWLGSCWISSFTTLMTVTDLIHIFCSLLLQRPGVKEWGSQDRRHSSTTQASAAQLHPSTYAFPVILSSCIRLYLSSCFIRVFLYSYLISFHRPFSSSSFVFVFVCFRLPFFLFIWLSFVPGCYLFSMSFFCFYLFPISNHLLTNHYHVIASFHYSLFPLTNRIRFSKSSSIKTCTRFM